MIEGDGWLPPVALTDSSLVRRAQAGDTRATGLIYERYHDRLCRVARMYLPDQDDVAEVVHDTFIKFFVALNEGRYTEQGKLDSYLCLACSRVALDLVRKLSYKQEYHAGLGQNGDSLHLLTETGEAGSHADVALDQVLGQERREAVYRLLECLTPKEAAALTLYGAGLTMRQIATHLTTTVPAIKARLWRARAAAEVLIENDPRFDAIRPEVMTRKRVSPSALPGAFRYLLEGNDSSAQSNTATEGLHH